MPEPTPDLAPLLLVLDLGGVFVFALSGALVGVRQALDLFGVIVLAGATGLGGGLLRDVLIGDVPPVALTDWRYLVVPVVAGVVAFVAHPAVRRMERLITVSDAGGLALFCVAGALKAYDAGLSVLAAALLGMVTGIGGGMIRDVLAGRVPVVFGGELYATPALAGAAVAAGGSALGLPLLAVAPAGAAVCLVWRLLAVWRRWQAPLPRGTSWWMGRRS